MVERGTFLLSAPLVIQRSNVHIDWCAFRSARELPHMLRFGHEADGYSVTNSMFSGGGIRIDEPMGVGRG